MLDYDAIEGLWNNANHRRYKRLGLSKPIVILDTIVLAVNAVADRIRRLGLRKVFAKPIGGRKIIYFDIGLHREGEQARLFEKWFGNRFDVRMFGFEANPDHFRHFSEVYAQRVPIKAENFALVGPAFDGDSVSLFLDGKKGLGDSLIPRAEAIKIEVPARRFSEWLGDQGIDLDGDLAILRMNIEGAEHEVIRDLAEAGLIESFDGMYGMWNDVWKKNTAENIKDFEKLIERENIRHFTFNGRDAKVPLRTRIIKYHIETDLMASRKTNFA